MASSTHHETPEVEQFFANLNKNVTEIACDNSKRLEFYINLASQLKRQAETFLQTEDLARSYVIVKRYLFLVLRTIPKHNGYGLPQYREQVCQIKQDASSMLAVLERTRAALVQQLTEPTENQQEEVGSNVAAPSSSSASEDSQKDISNDTKEIQKSLSSTVLSPTSPQRVTNASAPPPSVHANAKSSISMTQQPFSQLYSRSPVPSTNHTRTLPPSQQNSYPSLINNGGVYPAKPVLMMQPIQASHSTTVSHTHTHPSAPPAKGLPQLRSKPSAEFTLQKVNVPGSLLDTFAALAKDNTASNLETCGILSGVLHNGEFYITTLLIPKQHATSDTCDTMDEIELFEVQEAKGLMTLGWIHTHPSQTCFLSSVDLHTQCGYQTMLPEAVAIVVAPTDTDKPYGFFRLTTDSNQVDGLHLIQSCPSTGFHQHGPPEASRKLFEDAAHVVVDWTSSREVELVDLRHTH
eukprot:GILJ01007881.1.p1 GENE.GILJ01007881.1~~GILJ01007881.1.p1  ORF type:complete len:465 (+),score=60.60 GILJ01007881.1:101-1495(+)